MLWANDSGYQGVIMWSQCRTTAGWLSDDSNSQVLVLQKRNLVQDPCASEIDLGETSAGRG